MRSFVKEFITILIVITLTFMCSSTVYAGAEEDEQADIINQQLNTNEINGLNKEVEKSANEDFKKLLPSFNPEDILKDAVTGNYNPQIIPFLNNMLKYLINEIYTNVNIMVKLLIIIVLCSILKQLQTSFMSESVGELAFYACYAVIVAIMVVSLNTTLNLGREIIDGMVSFMHSTIPVLVTLMVSSGSVASGGILKPLLVISVEVVAGIFKNFLLPLVMFSTILSVVDNISEKVHISRITGFFKQICGWSIGIIMTVFIGIVSVQGSLGAVVDGVTSKTTKYAISTFVPVAGKYLADAADAVLGCSLLIKNGAGLVVMIGIISICLIPLIKLSAIIIIYRLTCALVEPISEKRITGFLSDVASSMTYILGIACAVAFMFLMSITAIISAGSLSAAIR